MSRLDSLIGIGMICRSIAASTLYPRLVTHLTTVVILSVLTALMAGTLIIGLFGAGFFTMLQYEVPVVVAMVVTAGIAILATAILARITLTRARQLRDIVAPTPLADQVSSIASAFMDGWENPAPKERDAARQ